MISKKNLAKEADFLQGLQIILETYEEIAASRMERIRSSVLKSRDFLLEINAIFQQVKSSYKNRIDILMKKNKVKDPSKLTFIKRNGKTVYVLVTANTRLYGEIIQKTYDVFIENLIKENKDVIIIGKLGASLFDADKEKFKTTVTYFDFPDNRIDYDALKKITEVIIQYEQAVVFYQQFSSVINQLPIITNISGDPLPWEENGPEVKFLFEPSLEKIMAFFEKEIFKTIFEQTIFESELAKFAARMLALDASSGNTKNKVKELLFQKEQFRHQQINRKQLETFSSMKLWKK